jgi:iron complex outermembrane receptor protein
LSVNDDGSRKVDALFGELFIPLFGSGNATYGFEQLSLSAAVRYEHYSDFGSTTNPKFGVTWKPFQGLTLKGSYGTSFRAPTFTEVSTIAGGAGLYFDTLPGAAGNQIGIGIAGGNPNLKPESATTYSFGFESRAAGDRRAARQSQLFPHQLYRSNPGTARHRGPDHQSAVQELRPAQSRAATIAALVASGLPINQTINQSQVTFIADGRRQNLGTSLLRGLDFTLGYDWSFGDVKMDAGIQGTYVLDYLFEAVPGSGLVDVLDTFGFAQKFRTQADIGMDWNGLRARATWNHLAGYYNTTVTPRQEISNYDTFDLSVGYEINRHFTISADVRNLFNENPPFVDTTFGYDPQSANPIPRIFALTGQVKF